MKRWLARSFLVLPFVVSLLAIVAYGQDELQTQPIGPFLGLNNVDNPYTLEEGKSQDLLNVDLTPGGRSVKKRSGYGVTWTLAIPTTPVRGIYNFFNESGNAVNLFFNDTRGAASVDGAAPVVLFSTGPNGATYQCSDAAGFAYCANTSRTSILKIDGSNDDTITTMRSTGTMVAITPERLVHAGFLEDPSRIDFSKANDFREWRLGGNPADPISFTIVAPGAKITHIVYAHGRIYWFKTNSFGFILEGATHDDWVARTLNSDVGTLFNTSVFRDDILYFQGQDSHWYAWDGSNLVKLSRNIDADISVGSLAQVSNSTTQTTAADFNRGSILPRVYVDTETASNSMQMTYPDTFATFRNGNSGTKRVWIESNRGSGNETSDGSYLYINRGAAMGTDNQAGVISAETITGLNQGTTISVEVRDFTAGTGNTIQFNFGIDATTGTQRSCDQFRQTSGPHQISSVIRRPGSDTSTLQFTNVFVKGLDVNVNLSTPQPFTVDIFVQRDYWNFSLNKSSSMISGRTGVVMPDTATVYMCALFNTDSLDRNVHVDNFAVIPQTVTFLSSVFNAPDITSWGTLDVTKQDNGGSHSVYFRSSLDFFSLSSSTPPWTLVTPGQTISLSTGDWFQFRDDFSITNGTQAPRLDDFTINWTENSDQETDKTYAIYHDNALWWSVKSGAGVTTNNRIFKLDLINKEWLRHDIAANGFLVYNKELYFGGASTGAIFQYGTLNSDNGTAINAYWKSRDFSPSDPFVDRDLWDLSFVTAGNTGTNMTVTYELNGSTATSFSVPLSRGSDAFVKRNVPFPLGTAGNTINFTFGNNAADQPFEIFGGQFRFSDRIWRQEDN